MKAKQYKIKKVEENVFYISGKGNHKLWKKADKLTDFSSPWNNNKIEKTEFRALWDSKTFYFCFIVKDSKVHIDASEDKYKSINNSDRVELFFSINEHLNPYYCLEIDPTSRIMDFKAKPNKGFNFNWNWPSEDIDVKSSISKKQFIVEGAISISSLSKLGVLKNGAMRVGIFRAKYAQQEKGNFIPTWITWVNPMTETPNFHIASSFGKLKFG